MDVEWGRGQEARSGHLVWQPGRRVRIAAVCCASKKRAALGENAGLVCSVEEALPATPITFEALLTCLPGT